MVYKPFALSVKVVVLDSEGRCLLIRRSMKSKANAGKWEFPGGKLDPTESIDQALFREVYEETGLRVAISHVLGAAESESEDRKIAYLIMEATPRSGEVTLSDEHDDFKWVTIPELPNIDMPPQFLPFAREYAESQTQ